MLTVEFERLNLKPGMRVLDVGCGGGRHVRGVRALPGVTAVALDFGKKEIVDTAASLRELDGLPLRASSTVAGARPDHPHPGQCTSICGGLDAR